MKVECYGATAPEEGRQHTENQDAFLIVRAPVLTAALADGAGNARQSAKHALRLLERFIGEATLGQMLSPDLWSGWVRLLDSALLGGPQTTLVAAAIVGSVARCVTIGDSRIYLVAADGGCELLTEDASKARLGSGEAKPYLTDRRLVPRDILLLVSDGAWTPLGSYRLDRAVRSATSRHFSDVPQAVLEAAGQHGRADDMTAVAVRLVPGPSA
jgi:serine/threonine protein phosphatase PrpC